MLFCLSSSGRSNRAERALPKPSSYREVPEMLRLAQPRCQLYISATSEAAPSSNCRHIQSSQRGRCAANRTPRYEVCTSCLTITVQLHAPATIRRPVLYYLRCFDHSEASVFKSVYHLDLQLSNPINIFFSFFFPFFFPFFFFFFCRRASSSICSGKICQKFTALYGPRRR